MGEPTEPVLPEVTPPESPLPEPPSDEPEVQPPVTAPQPPAAGPVELVSPPERSVEQDCHCRRDDEPGDGGGFFFLGAGAFALDSLNNRFAANGYQELARFPTVIGGEGRGISDTGFVAGVKGAAILYPDAGGPGDIQTNLSGGFGMLDLGFAFLNTERLALTLTAGIGGYGWSLDISDRASASFDELLATPARSTSISRGGVLTGLTLGFDGRVPLGPVQKTGEQGYFTVGLRLCGLYGPALSSWSQSTGGDVGDAPNMGLVGGYAALALGFGGRYVPSEERSTSD